MFGPLVIDEPLFQFVVFLSQAIDFSICRRLLPLWRIAQSFV
jgi:hypothetical protein